MVARLLRWFGAGTSLRRQLLLWLLLPQLVLWLGGALFTFKLAERYANQAVDASLSQASRALARQVKPMGTGLLIDFPRAAQDVLEADPADKLLYTVSSPPGEFILGNRQLPLPGAVPERPRLGEPYYYDSQVANPQSGGTDRLRVAALYLRYGEADGDDVGRTMLVQVARSSANREELARRLLTDMVLPLSLLMVLMTMIVGAGIRAGLAPIARLRSLVEGRKPNDLRPIELHVAPQELRTLAGAINELLEAVQSNVQAQRRFISDAAHQLRTPLAGLKSQTELALKEAAELPGEPALQERLQRVHESASRSAHLVNQLLTLARTEPESQGAQSRVKLDLARLAREVTAELVPRALQAGVDLGFEGADDATPLWVQGVPLLLREALVNVIDNALRYAGRGATVTVQVGTDGAQAVLSIRDNGPGVAAGTEGRLFERFYRATLSGNGCGLGLAIVKEIVERHGGRVSAAPVQPHGLQLTLHLPLTA
ncbi:sensor histidine kinase [Pelomonas sp. APW6]|uniref:histidine kinase n=1 Tax=Roseateles subflavus TaxID=3053353 RepID=A0ABT7LKV4_9BURK|nr:sensor histidine kinase [Pelomonas sp. APW6]MDL5033501.1 sensor histidine kinase [Pelomonas sp. APW6]